MITIHGYRYLTFKTSLPRLSCGVGLIMPPTLLCNGLSSYASGQGLDIRAEHIDQMPSSYVINAIGIESLTPLIWACVLSLGKAYMYYIWLGT